MKDNLESKESRRNFLIKSGLLIAATSLSGVACSRGSEKATKADKVPPTEDLMREHGVLRRIMFVYDEIARRLQGGEESLVQDLSDANRLTRQFVQDYHEKAEERHVFNRFAIAGKLLEPIAILFQQHLAGRKLIDQVKIAATETGLRNPLERLKIVDLLNSFNRLYRHHAAWEDTVLFPAFRSIISPGDFIALGETFAEEEEKRFGPDGYEKIVAQVAAVEKKLGIYDLRQFTPRL